MNTPIVSTEAKARLTEAVKNYTPPPPEKYRALEEVKDCVIELRNKKASYQTIRAMLHENVGIEISHQTIARYCREVLGSKVARPKRKGQRSPAVSNQTPPDTQREFLTAPSSSSLRNPRRRGPHIARVEDL